MWSIATSAIAGLGHKKSAPEVKKGLLELSDEETDESDAEEALECPICWESFNIVENVPYVLWCGHTLCKQCVLGIQRAVFRFQNQKIQIPFFISCPWCHLPSFRLVYKGNLKFPRKNFFLLWMVESLNGDRVRSSSSICCEHQPAQLLMSNVEDRRAIVSRRHEPSRTANRGGYLRQAGSTHSEGNLRMERHRISFHKSLDLFIHFTAKFLPVILLLLIVFFAIPISATILALYLLVTVLFALPSFLVLYFAYPTIEWLLREITN